MRLSIRATIKPRRVDDRFVEKVRTTTERRPPPTMLPRGVSHRPLDPGDCGGATGEWVGVESAARVVLYLHGGYYIAGHPRTYRNLAGRLAAGLRAEVVTIDYRLAPEQPYPAALDDAIQAYRAVLDWGIDPATVAVVGDSAGGGLALALLQRARAEALALPGATVLFSPWLDLTCSSPSIDRNDDADDMLSAEALRTAAAHYAGDTAQATAGLSPLFGDLTHLPPLFVTVDNSETLLDDTLRLVDRCAEMGVEVELRRTTGLFHVWPVTVPFVREARRTVDEVVTFLDGKLA